MARARATSRKSSSSSSSKENDAKESSTPPSSPAREQGPLRAADPAVGLGIQPKLTVNEPGDKYEREADRVADAVIRVPNLTKEARTQKQLPPDRIQRRAQEEGESEPGDGAEEAVDVARESGEPLPDDVQSFFETRMNEDFGNVRVHTGREADRAAHAINARAFTLGNSVVLRSDEYRPETHKGRKLLAHELAHVVQQGWAMPNSTRSNASSQRPTSILLQRQKADEKSSGLSKIPEGGTVVNKIGLVEWDRDPELRMRSSRTTEADNIIRTLSFNTRVQVIKRFPGHWYLVSTECGEIGYVAARYVTTNLLEPKARRHRVKEEETAIGIAEKYYKEKADDWGQDLRFFVNILAHINDLDTGKGETGWRSVSVDAGDMIWIPSPEYALSLQDQVSSGSISYEAAELIGVASAIERTGQFWDDLKTAVSRSTEYLGKEIKKQVKKALVNALVSIAMLIVGAAAIVGLTTVIGAAVGSAPGAAKGFEVGVFFVKWLGLAMLLGWIAGALYTVSSRFATFFQTVWNARGDERKLDRGAKEFAKAVAVLLGKIVEVLVLYGAAKGGNSAIGLIRGSKLAVREGKRGPMEKAIAERIREMQSGETKMSKKTPEAVVRGVKYGVEIVSRGREPLGEFDKVDIRGKIFVENKSATGLRHPRSQQTPQEWVQKAIYEKTKTRIENLAKADRTRKTDTGSENVPTIDQLREIKNIRFKIDAPKKVVSEAVNSSMQRLRNEFPDWNFSAEYGFNVPPQPVPELKDDATSKKEAAPAQ